MQESPHRYPRVMLNALCKTCFQTFPGYNNHNITVYLLDDRFCKSHRFTYDEAIKVESVTQAVCDLALRFGESAEGEESIMVCDKFTR